MFTFREAEEGERNGERGEMRRGRKDGEREREKGMKTGKNENVEIDLERKKAMEIK